jgi:predicted SAM-dependent methyltransferase
LITKYKDHHINLKKIEEVDFVWRGESYSEVTGKSKYYDWIIASHVIEHTPDLIGFLNDCDTILKDDGVVSLVIPDKRYCFDYYRPITGISRVIDSHFMKNKIHTPGSVAEYYLNVVSKGGIISWDSNVNGEYNLIHSFENARQGMHEVLNEKANPDVHAWCFTPYSFRLIIQDLFCLGFIPFKEVDFFPTEGSEFYITLGRKGNSIQKSRLEMLDIIDSEIKDTVPVQEVFPKTILSKIKYFIKRLITRHYNRR